MYPNYKDSTETLYTRVDWFSSERGAKGEELELGGGGGGMYCCVMKRQLPSADCLSPSFPSPMNLICRFPQPQTHRI
jgi:hypothetical protein